MTYYSTTRSLFSISSMQLLVDDIVNLSGSAGYTVVDTVSVNSYTWTLIRNSSQNNGISDFVFAVGIVNSFGRFSVTMMQSWDVNSKTAFNYAPFSGAPDITNWYVESANAYLPGSSDWMWTTSLTVQSGYNINIFAKSKTIAITSIESNNIGTASSKQQYNNCIAIGVYESLLPSSADICPVFIFQNAITPNAINGATFRDFNLGHGRFLNTSGVNSRTGFQAYIIPVNNFDFTADNKYTNNAIYSKTLIVQKAGIAITDSVFTYSPKGISEDLYIGRNPGNPDLRTSWTFSGSSYYARNAAHNGTTRLDPAFGKLLILE